VTTGLIFETKVMEIIKHNADIKSFRFDRPPNLDFKAGQFMFVTLMTDQGEMRKHFTISSSPTEFGYIEFTKKLTGHFFSNVIDLLKVGDWVRIDAPYGNFTFEGEYDKIAILTGGIGITPFISICRYIMDNGLDTDIVLIYGNRSEQDIVFKDELEKMQNEKFKIVHTLEKPSKQWKGLRGFINEAMIKREIPDYFERIFYICGPPIMIKVMSEILARIGISSDEIKTETFIGY
jgi:ferredoxin-NADP reductase